MPAYSSNFIFESSRTLGSSNFGWNYFFTFAQVAPNFSNNITNSKKPREKKLNLRTKYAFAEGDSGLSGVRRRADRVAARERLHTLAINAKLGVSKCDR